MVSLQASRENLDQESLSKKRKWNGNDDLVQELTWQFENVKRQTPFPLYWQQCLDVKTGQIYYYNTMTKKRDSNSCHLNPAPMSLELNLNLPCQPVGSNQEENNMKQDSGKSTFFSSMISRNSKGLNRSPSWLTFEDDQQEMFTTVCKKCHLLVIICKSSPTCPNCKFMQPSVQSFNKSLSLSC